MQEQNKIYPIKFAIKWFTNREEEKKFIKFSCHIRVPDQQIDISFIFQNFKWNLNSSNDECTHTPSCYTSNLFRDICAKFIILTVENELLLGVFEIEL